MHRDVLGDEGFCHSVFMSRYLILSFFFIAEARSIIIKKKS